MKLFRWKAIIPLSLLLVLMALVWLLLLDGMVRRGIEFAGSQITGAKVDVQSADIKPLAGRLLLRGIQAADPEAPMSNLFEVSEVVADLRIAPLLQKKIVVDTLAVRGVRFGTPRTESGELPRKAETTGAVAGRLSEWTENLPIPVLSLRGVGETVNVTAIDNDSLSTIRLARVITSAADSSKESWQGQIRSLDVQAEIDTARAILEKLGNINLRNIGIRQIREIRDTLNSAREITRSVEEKRDTLRGLVSGIEDGVRDLRERIESLDDARRIDFRYAQSLLQIPSLDAPNIGPALFAEMALEHLQPFLRILDRIERYTPPGLKARQQTGPKRVRMAGTTVHFPRLHSYPAFLLELGEITLSLGDDRAPEDYTLRIEGLNTDPTVYGRPTRFSFDRASGSAGRRRIRARAVLDHTASIPVDSLEVVRDGMGMGEVSLGSIGGQLDLGTGTTSLNLLRTGDEMDVAMSWRCPDVRWESTETKRGVEEFVWRTISGLRSVQLDVRMRRTPAGFDLNVRSNVATELARGLESQLGDQIRSARARVNSEVERRIGSYVEQAREQADAVEAEVKEQIELYGRQLEEVKAEIENRLNDITRVIPPGIIPPR